MVFGIRLAVFHNDIDKCALAEEVVHKTVARFVVQVFRCVNLHNLTHITNHHTVGNRHGFGLVMCDENNRKVEFPLQGLDFKTHRLTEFRVKV